ncbi:hypothetical protein LZ31DRAFT_242878 [Colletotrichum somersetense]|nr:hypothetical protein LZ31DRAFT_242878 [Colletotrichum somersetense]
MPIHFLEQQKAANPWLPTLGWKDVSILPNLTTGREVARGHTPRHAHATAAHVPRPSGPPIDIYGGARKMGGVFLIGNAERSREEMQRSNVQSRCWVIGASCRKKIQSGFISRKREPPPPPLPPIGWNLVHFYLYILIVLSHRAPPLQNTSRSLETEDEGRLGLGVCT